ncbi:hypothetical protein [Brachybacterium fresconis]|uniref:DUF3618 domain-containing protein n=1 Tax=Brachybacterium fresconis TaxID=173363 RepID=A0ABS4YH73_9MICO|nr:hypothetical protein [Brachybacterium fresconis]
MAKKNSLDDMRDEAYRRQDNLASDIDELVDRVNPKNAVTRWKNEIVGSVKGFSDADDEKTSSVPLTAIAGGVIGVVVLGAGVAIAVVLSRREPTQGQKVARTIKQTRRQTARSAKDVRAALKKSSLPGSTEAEKYAGELDAVLQDVAKKAEKRSAAAGR